MEWSRGPTIGRGSSAMVSLATTTSGELLAVKSAELARSGFLQREQHFLSQLSSPRIVKYMGCDTTCENKIPMYNLFMEYVPSGTILDAIKRHGGSLSEPTIRSCTHQILQGLSYLHLNGFVHCDIKGQNVLIGKEGVKIADLGCANLASAATTSAFSGTPVYMAPEVARGEEQGCPADLWALGCTVIEMATGSNPWPEVSDPVSALYRIGYSGEVPEFPRWLSAEGKDFLSKCLVRDPEERWTADQLLQHPFVVAQDLQVKTGEFQFVRNSPTNVLDQDFWDSFEVSDSCPDPTRIASSSSSSNSLEERIKRLIGGVSSPPSWADEEGWVIIRSNGIEESIKLSDQNKEVNVEEEDVELTHIDSFMFLMGNDEEELELESIIGIGDLSLDYCLDEISDGTSFGLDPLLSCDYFDISLYQEFLNLMEKLINIHPCSMQLCLDPALSNDSFKMCFYINNSLFGGAIVDGMICFSCLIQPFSLDVILSLCTLTIRNFIF